jgi:outer membrane protein assembly factor BamD (BamD/ComL family)
MQAIPFSKCALAGVAALFLAGCNLETGGAGGGFQRDYNSAREALEAGKYDKASRLYARLMDQAGPLQPRIQLEYAHSELRAGNSAKAAQLAANLAQSQKGQDRAAALSVLGTAQHEQWLAHLQKGETEAGTRLLKAADATLSEVLKSYPQMDPLGSLEGRRASIRARLKRL